MTLYELKEAVCKGNLPEDLLVLVCENNTFLAEQYLEKYCEVSKRAINKINTIFEVTSSALSLVLDQDSMINVLKTDVFDEVAEDYFDFKNCIIICNKIDKKIEPNIQEFIINIKAPEEWQIKAYMQTICPGLEKAAIDWLYLSAKKDLYRITNELDKIKLFPRNQQQLVYSKIRFEANSDLFDLPLFTFTDAIIEQNKPVVKSYFEHEDFCAIEPLAVVKTLLTKYKKMFMVLHGQGLSLETMGVSYSYAKFIKEKIHFSEKFLTEAIKFLSDIDYQLKAGRLELTKSEQMTYITCYLLSLPY